MNFIREVRSMILGLELIWSFLILLCVSFRNLEDYFVYVLNFLIVKGGFIVVFICYEWY